MSFHTSARHLRKISFPNQLINNIHQIPFQRCHTSSLIMSRMVNFKQEKLGTRNFSKMFFQPNRQLHNLLVKSNANNALIQAQEEYSINGVNNISPYPLYQSLDEAFSDCRSMDPFEVAKEHLVDLQTCLMSAIGSDNPTLKLVASQLMRVPGKRVRPVIVILMAQALRAGLRINPIISSTEKMNLTPRECTLGHIAELIHTGSLLHDDVLDNAETRRGEQATHVIHGNKMAILSGDFLLARASILLARLRNNEVTEIMSLIIEHLVKGEVMQMTPSSKLDPEQLMQSYLTKTFYKTASLMANSCLAVAAMGDYGSADENKQKIAFEYGKNAGLAFQIIDDILDFEGTQESLGKPSLNDLKSGIVTAPVLLALDQAPEIGDLMSRRFKCDGDVSLAYKLVQQTDGIERAKHMANQYGKCAVGAASQLAPSDARDALISLIELILKRQK